MTLFIRAQQVPSAILELVKARIIANRARSREQRLTPPPPLKTPRRRYYNPQAADRRTEPGAVHTDGDLVIYWTKDGPAASSRDVLFDLGVVPYRTTTHLGQPAFYFDSEGGLGSAIIRAVNIERVFQVFERNYTIETWMYWTTVPFADAEEGGAGSSQLLWTGGKADLQIVGSGDQLDPANEGIGAQLTIRPGDGTTYGAEGSLRPKPGGQWYHVAYQRDGNDQFLHVGGEPVAVKWEGGPPIRYSIQNKIFYNPFSLLSDEPDEGLSELQFVLNANTARGLVSAAVGQVRITKRARYGSRKFKPPTKPFVTVPGNSPSS